VDELYKNFRLHSSSYEIKKQVLAAYACALSIVVVEFLLGMVLGIDTGESILRAQLFCLFTFPFFILAIPALSRIPAVQGLFGAAVAVQTQWSVRKNAEWRIQHADGGVLRISCALLSPHLHFS
jgi:hypothetical protein